MVQKYRLLSEAHSLAVSSAHTSCDNDATSSQKVFGIQGLERALECLETEGTSHVDHEDDIVDARSVAVGERERLGGVAGEGGRGGVKRGLRLREAKEKGDTIPVEARERDGQELAREGALADTRRTDKL